MADSSGNETPTPFSMPLAPLPVGGAKKPSKFFTLPDDLLMLIAQIALTWGGYEHYFNEFLEALQRAARTETPTFRLGYPKKCTLLLERCDRIFKHGSDTYKYVEQILSDASEPYLERNLIIHGQASIQIKTGEIKDGKIPGTVALIFRGERDDKEFFELYDKARLINLLQTIAHAYGRLEALLKNSDRLPLSSTDRSSLQAFLDKDYRPSPIPTMPPRPTESS